MVMVLEPKPVLKFTEDALRSVLSDVYTPDTLVITDAYNFEYAKHLRNVVQVDDTDGQFIDEVSRRYRHCDVVAVGGCTALDFGRACARSTRLVVIPTILSTCCISSNRSVIRRGNIYHSEVTTAPEVTIISMPTVDQNHADVKKNWSASGLGDLFSAFAAVAEKSGTSQHETRGLLAVFESSIPLCLQTLNWMVVEPFPLHRSSLAHLARILHEFSAGGREKVPIGAEHEFYYALRQQQSYDRSVATHGKLVSAGALLTLRRWSEERHDFFFYEKIRQLFIKIGLPVDFTSLASTGVTRDHIVSACNVVQGYDRFFDAREFSLVDRVFAAGNNVS